MGKIAKQYFYICAAIVCLILSGYAQAATKENSSAAKQNMAAVKDTILPFAPGSWTLVVLPDTQKYPKTYPGLLHLQMQWILENKDKHNIVYVLQNGDVVNNNNPKQWECAHKAFGRLDGKVPYAIALGNHDYDRSGSTTDRSTMAHIYFPPSRFANWPTFGGCFEQGRIDNTYHLFKAGGQDWLILTLEWACRDEVLAWGNKIMEKYPDHKAIILTHAYLYSDSTRYDWELKGSTQKWNPGRDGSDGEDIWQKMLKKHRNSFMVISGHVLNDGLGFLVSKTDYGNPVYQMLVNYQMKDIGGGAWLRILEFLPDGQTIQVKTYSPLYEDYKTDPDNQFVIKVPVKYWAK